MTIFTLNRLILAAESLCSALITYQRFDYQCTSLRFLFDNAVDGESVIEVDRIWINGRMNFGALLPLAISWGKTTLS